MVSSKIPGLLPLVLHTRWESHIQGATMLESWRHWYYQRKHRPGVPWEHAIFWNPGSNWHVVIFQVSIPKSHPSGRKNCKIWSFVGLFTQWCTPEKYFAEHPEYYALNKLGKRERVIRRKGTAVPVSNEGRFSDRLRTAQKRLAQIEYNHCSVSPEWCAGACTCEKKCRKTDEGEEVPQEEVWYALSTLGSQRRWRKDYPRLRIDVGLSVYPPGLRGLPGPLSYATIM